MASRPLIKSRGDAQFHQLGCSLRVLSGVQVTVTNIQELQCKGLCEGVELRNHLITIGVKGDLVGLRFAPSQPRPHFLVGLVGHNPLL